VNEIGVLFMLVNEAIRLGSQQEQSHGLSSASRQDKPGKGGSYVADGNLSLESRGFDTLPVKISHQPEASLACECGNALLEA
jgi:hypothetical protein